MKTLALLLALLVLPLSAATAQETDAPEGAVIASVETPGLDLAQLSSSLRGDVGALAGQPLNRQRLGELAKRLEDERPGVAVSVRAVAAPDGKAQVTFFVANMDNPDEWNVNAQYIVESVDVSGMPLKKASLVTLRGELNALANNRLDPKQVEQLAERIRTELPGYDVKYRMTRGSQPGRISLIFDVSEGESLRWIPFVPSRSKVIYHTDQVWSGALDIPLGGSTTQVTFGFVFEDDDELIEEYTGYGFRIESRKLGTRRLGLSFELSMHHQMWQPATLSALDLNPSVPEAYRKRVKLEPLVTFAFNPLVRVTGGVSISELESQSRSPESQMASAAVLSVAYGRKRENDSTTPHDISGAYEFRTARDAIGSDLVYTRHLGHARYRFRSGKSLVTADVALGGTEGSAPLFERFSLGDSRTLRGWNKYDIAPTGGDRMWHQSIEYSYRNFAVFFDAGSMWDQGADAGVKTSTGFGYHGDHFFMMLGFPLNADKLRAAFMMGVRF